MRMMFSQAEKKIFSPDFELSLRAGEGEFASLALPGTLSMSLGGLECNTFGEDGCLTDKFKVHCQLDSFGGEAEIFQTIPFGTEFRVKHRFECASNFIRMTLDIDPGKGFIDELKLEDVKFNGEIKKLRIFRADGSKIVCDEIIPEKKNKVFYDANVPALAVQVEDSTGAVAEFGCGNDIWRHRTIELYESCIARFCVEGNDEEIIIRRNALKLAPEYVMPKRSFRFKSYIAFAEKIYSLPPAEMVICEKDCMCAASVRRSMRDALRRFTGSSLQIQADQFLCFDAGHLERPGREKLIHWSVEDFFEIMLWGSKMFAKNGVVLTFLPPQDSDAAELAALKVLQLPLQNNIEVYDEQF